MIQVLTIFFTCAAAVYCGLTAAVTFSASVHFAFGWVLGQLFLWAAWVAFVSWVITRVGLQKERAWWDARRKGEGGIFVDGEKRRLDEGRGETGDRAAGEKHVKEGEDPQSSGAAREAYGYDPNAIMEEKRDLHER